MTDDQIRQDEKPLRKELMQIFRDEDGSERDYLVVKKLLRQAINEGGAQGRIASRWCELCVGKFHSGDWDVFERCLRNKIVAEIEAAGQIVDVHPHFHMHPTVCDTPNVKMLHIPYEAFQALKRGDPQAP